MAVPHSGVHPPSAGDPVSGPFHRGHDVHAYDAQVGVVPLAWDVDVLLYPEAKVTLLVEAPDVQPVAYPGEGRRASSR